MPIQGNMGPIMRKPDPQKNLRGPVPEKDEKGVMILGSRMTREDLLEYIRTKRREAEAKRNHQPPPPPPTERQRAQTNLELEAGKRRLQKFADEEAKRVATTLVVESEPVYVPPDGAGTADMTFDKPKPVATGLR